MAISIDLGIDIGELFQLHNKAGTPNFLCNLGIPIDYPKTHIRGFDQPKSVAVLYIGKVQISAHIDLFD